MDDIPRLVPDFYLHALRYDVGSLIVTLAVGGDLYFEVQFDPPRAFRSYAESDFWQYLQTFKGEPLLSTPHGGTGVFMSESAPYVVEYRKYVRPSEPEPTFSCLIATAQECVEVVCFERPTIRFLQVNSGRSNAGPSLGGWHPETQVGSIISPPISSGPAPRRRAAGPRPRRLVPD